VTLAIPPGANSKHLAVDDDVTLHYVEQGQGPAVVLLHGFPEFWYSWRRQLSFLGGEGSRAIAPDLRGYNDSSCPAGVRNYRMAFLVQDIARLIKRLEVGPAVVIGHDWGGVIAWRLAALHPHLVRGLVILNAPHPFAFRRELRTNPVQWLRSWYAGFFQMPWLPEAVLRARGFAPIRHMLRVTAVSEDAFTEADLEAYAQAIGRPGRLTAALNYYRAALRYSADLHSGPSTVTTRTLVIWGERDPALSSHLADGLERWASNIDVVRIPDASHWVQHDAPGQVNELLRRFMLPQNDVL
jgi:epoxide hydrolase 4